MSNLSITPLRAYYDTRLEQDDIILLSIICLHTDRDGYCFPSLKRLSAIFSPIVGKEPAYNISSLSRKIARLQAAGYIAAAVHRKAESGGYTSNVYKVILDAVLPAEFDRRADQEPLANASEPMQAPHANAPGQMQAPLANSPGQMQAPLANAPGQKQTNAPHERPSTERKEDAPAAPPPPAVEKFREIRERYPPKENWELIAQVVGDSPGDLKTWEEVLRAYSALGWNRRSVTGPLEFFKRGEIPGFSFRDSGSKKKSSLIEWMRKEGIIGDGSSDQGDLRENVIDISPAPGGRREIGALTRLG